MARQADGEARAAGTQVLASGTCRVGVHARPFELRGRHPMAGFSWAGRWGRPGAGELWARALCVRDSDTDEGVVFCVVDLMSASLRLLQEVHELLRRSEHTWLVGRVILSGTHTHAAPGRFYGNRFYDRLAQPLGLRGFHSNLTATLAATIAEACILAAQSADSQPAGSGALSVLSAELWDAGGNRSLVAYLAAQRDREAPPPPAVAPDGLHPTRRAVDPRLTVLCARRDGKLEGVFAWYGCHATALGPKQALFDRDWPGVAVDLAEKALGCVCAVGAGPLGDVSPLPAEAYTNALRVDRTTRARDVAGFQGPALAQEVGGKVGQALAAIVGAEPAPALEATLPVTLDAGVFAIEARGSEPRWLIGVPALGGAEDGGPSVPFFDLIAEGFRSDSGPQRPKAPALGFLQDQLLGVVDIAPFHPWHRLRLGDHVIVTVPGEPTVTAAWTLERAVVAASGAATASVIGCAGDYAGYFTTGAEYGTQQYEGASTLYGPQALDWYRDQLLAAPRALPGRGEPLGLRAGELPQRGLDRLLSEAYELTPLQDRVVLAFGVELGQPLPTGVQLRCAGNCYAGSLRPVFNPDVDGKPTVQLCTGVFAMGSTDPATSPLQGAKLELLEGSGVRSLSIRTRTDAGNNGRPPAVAAPLRLGFIRRTLLGLGVLLAVLGCVPLARPAWLLRQLGWLTLRFDVLMTRCLGLTFLLLAVGILHSKNSRDLRVLGGYVAATALFAGVLAALFALSGGPHLGTIAAAVAVVLLAGFTVVISRQRGGRRRPGRYFWEFWRPLFWISWLTVVVGGGLLFCPSWFIWRLEIEHPRAALWLGVYGGGFWVNSVAMWNSRFTRDLRVVRGHVQSSVVFDAGCAVLFSLAVADGIFNAWGLVLVLAFSIIVVGFPRVARRARDLERASVLRPKSIAELARIIRDARHERCQVRVLGSGHSVPGAIYAAGTPGPPPPRPSTAPDVLVSLEYLDQVVDVDRKSRTITVQAGMHIGEDPADTASAQNNLLAHLHELQWALGDLGGVAHQTIAGFLSTGSAGGSLGHALQDNVVALRFVDGSGSVVNAVRGSDTFDAACVSMGLLGVLIEVTLRCEPRYQVKGREFTAGIEGHVASLPDGGWAGGGAAPRRIDLTSAGADGLAAYLSRVDYCRILWWPQPRISKMVIWEGWHTAALPIKEQPYRPDASWKQWAAGQILQVLAWSAGRGIARAVGRRLRDWAMPVVIRAFLPEQPRLFHAGWDVNLPMDTQVDDSLVPVDFTELWFPLERTAEVMQVLLDMYQDADVAGSFTAELYVARRSPAWLSPSFGRDCFRVDIFWFRRSPGDPVVDYFPQFYERLAAFEFRPHWGKYLPEPGSAQGAAYLRARYPCWQRFLEERQRFDPDGVFLSRYWRRHLGL